ncbi:hypothetical protein GCM10010344_44550 [Streptomyces bluensis]|nr:hypothetical protein GCM10010344_44550 [Streptomyces bluensis]
MGPVGSTGHQNPTAPPESVPPGSPNPTLPLGPKGSHQDDSVPQRSGAERFDGPDRMDGKDRMDRMDHMDRMDQTGRTNRTPGTPRTPRTPRTDRMDHVADRLRAGSRNGGRVGVTYKYFGAPDGATAARVPISMRPEELGGDELGMNGMFTKIKPETMAAMVLTGIEGVPLHRVPPLELVVLHPDYAVVKLPMTVVDPLRGIGEEAVGAAAFIWSTVPDRGGPRDAFNVYQLLHEWQDFSHRLHEAGHQPYCLVWP